MFNKQPSAILNLKIVYWNCSLRSEQPMHQPVKFSFICLNCWKETAIFIIIFKQRPSTTWIF